MYKTLLLLATIVAFCGCDKDFFQSNHRLEVYVTQDGDIPEAYRLEVYRYDELLKTDEFDRAQRGSNNITEVLYPMPGAYYFEVSTDTHHIRDSTAIYVMGGLKVFNTYLNK